jgi:LacI family transcriptional regulator
VIILVGGASENATYRREMAKRARALHEVGARLVLCGRPSLGEGVPTRIVAYDNEGGAYAITDYLIGQGHRRILYLGGPPGLSTTSARLAGFHRALSTRGITADPALERVGAFGQPFGYTTMRALLAGRPDFTAVFAANDMVAAGAHDALEEAGIGIPGEISLVGYDDLPIAQQLRPRLTTVFTPLEELGREGVRAGLGVDDPFRPDPDHVMIGTHVIIRDSVAPIGAD